ncbi:hypothetical protein ACVMFA_009503 [Bradyrhizobium liaoningense]
MVNLGGSKVSLERIEEDLMSFGGIRDAAAFTYQNQLGINQLSGAVVWSENVERLCQARAAQAPGEPCRSCSSAASVCRTGSDSSQSHGQDRPRKPEVARDEYDHESGLAPQMVHAGLPIYSLGVRIPIYSGQVFRLEAGHRSDLKPATIPK